MLFRDSVSNLDFRTGFSFAAVSTFSKEERFRQDLRAFLRGYLGFWPMGIACVSFSWEAKMLLRNSTSLIPFSLPPSREWLEPITFPSMFLIFSTSLLSLPPYFSRGSAFYTVRMEPCTRFLSMLLDLPVDLTTIWVGLAVVGVASSISISREVLRYFSWACSWLMEVEPVDFSGGSS